MRLHYSLSSGTSRIKSKAKLVVAASLLGVVGVLPALVTSAAPNVVVSPVNTQGWTSTAAPADTRPGGAVALVGNATAPAGTGAVKLTTDATTTSKAQYMHAANTSLASVAALSYQTKQNSASFSGGDASYQLQVVLDGVNSASFTTFVYEPYENGTVTPGAWQAWDVAAGQMWSSKSVNLGACSVTAGGGGAPFYTLANIKAMCPNALVVGYGVNIGSNNPSYDVEADLLNFNGTVYDFENLTNNCVFVTVGNQYKLQNDCVTQATILIPQGKTLNGQHHTITAVDPAGGHFLGAVVKNAGSKASVKNLKLSANNLAVVCDDGANRLRGILFDGANGEITNNIILAVNQGNSGCQEGNGIEARNFGPGDVDITTGQRKYVVIKNNLVQKFNKGGIVANGYLDADIKNNVVKSANLSSYTAANGVQVGFNARAEVDNNRIEGNQWSGGGDYAATAILVYQAKDSNVVGNTITGNSDIGIAVEDSFGISVKNNKVKDTGTDVNADGYDIGIENAYYDLDANSGQENYFCGNKVSGFTTPFYGVDQSKCGKGKGKKQNNHKNHHKNCRR
jgi:parallel beta-helix repeat protein